MVKVNSQIGKTRSLALPINGNFWQELEEWKMPDCLGFRKKEVLTHQTLRQSQWLEKRERKRKSQWLREFDVARLRKMLLLSTGNISKVVF